MSTVKELREKLAELPDDVVVEVLVVDQSGWQPWPRWRPLDWGVNTTYLDFEGSNSTLSLGEY